MKGFTREKLLNWGLLKDVYKEEIVDEKIKQIKLPDDFVMEKIIEKWLKVNGIQSNDSLKTWLFSKGLNVEQWKTFVIRDYKWRLWCIENFKKDLPSYYLKRKPLLDLVTYSLIRVKDQDLALELYLRIKEKEAEFFELSMKFSEGPESRMGGVVGPVNLKQTHPVLAKLLLISQEKQLWPPKKVDNWWIIVRLENIQNTEFNEEVASLLASELGSNFLSNESEKLNINEPSNVKKDIEKG